MYYVGSNGFSWSSSIGTTKSVYFLHFQHGEITPNYLSNRSYGFPLRCLQE
ncbi:MAG: hypothetical protein K2K83_02670 [Rikenella sp.]|nr:hypothetical protein [Rikenella sp.]